MIAWEEPWDMFESAYQTIVVPVNCVGVMGNGLALAFKHKYPQLFTYYTHLCKTKQLKVGTVHYYSVDPFKRILIFPTKDDWRNDSKLEYIEAGLKAFVASYERNAITSIVFPALGCGKGQLAYESVLELLYQYLDPLPIFVGICKPYK